MSYGTQTKIRGGALLRDSQRAQSATFLADAIIFVVAGFP
jgi:hypothetical protein